MFLICISSLAIAIHLFNSYKENSEYKNIDTDNLLKQNPDYIGWLDVKDVVSLPVVQTDNNTFYLSHSFSKKENKIGCLFIDKNVLPQSNNIIIHGHNNHDSSMFSLLTKYKNEDFYKTHKEIIFTSKDNVITNYTVISVINYNVSDIQEFNIYSPDITDTYLENIKTLSIFSSDLPISTDDTYITLSTCDEEIYGTNGRLVIIGVSL